MRNLLVGFVATLFAALVVAQTPPTSVEKILQFAHTTDARSLQEIAQVVRATLELPQATVADTGESLTLRGTTDQISAADWLFSELDRAPSSPRQHSTSHRYVLPGDKEGIVRIFQSAHTASMQEFQELAQLIRTVPEMRRMFTYNAVHAMVVRGTAAQIALAEALFDEVDRPVKLPLQHAASAEFLLAGDKEGVTRVFYVAHAKSVQAFQEIAQVMRTVPEVRRTFTYNAQRAITVRGTAEQVAMAEWLFNELDQPATVATEGPREFRTPGAADDVMRVFYLPETRTVQEFQNIAQEVRVKARIMRLFTYNDRRALVVRAGGAQVTAAERIVRPD